MHLGKRERALRREIAARRRANPHQESTPSSAWDKFMHSGMSPVRKPRIQWGYDGRHNKPRKVFSSCQNEKKNAKG